MVARVPNHRHRPGRAIPSPPFPLSFPDPFPVKSFNLQRKVQQWPGAEPWASPLTGNPLSAFLMTHRNQPPRLRSKSAATRLIVWASGSGASQEAGRGHDGGGRHVPIEGELLAGDRHHGGGAPPTAECAFSGRERKMTFAGILPQKIMPLLGRQNFG